MVLRERVRGVQHYMTQTRWDRCKRERQTFRWVCGRRRKFRTAEPLPSGHLIEIKACLVERHQTTSTQFVDRAMGGHYDDIRPEGA